MKFTPTANTIRNLLKSGCRFSIPSFQREYSWDRKNIEEYLSDITENLAIDIEEKSVLDQPYFLGTMLFIGDFKEKPDKPIEVIDGQQRLTTITILLSALSDKFREIGENKLSEIVFDYVLTTDDNGEEVRVLNTKTSYPYFVYYIQDREKKIATKPNTEEEILIAETYQYFLNQLSEKNIKSRLINNLKLTDDRQKEDFSEGIIYLDILKTIRDQVLNCTFISIAAEDKDQANKIFAILNAKGKHLLSVDLIKNRIFEELKDSVDAIFAEEKWKEIKILLATGEGRIEIGTFFRHYWASKYSKTSENKLYNAFCRAVPKDVTSYRAFLSDLHYNAEVYSKIINPTREDYNNRKEYFWLVQSLKDITYTFNVVQARFALLSLFDAKERKVIKHEDFKNAVKKIEHFHFAFSAICQLRASGFEGKYSRFAIKLRKANNIVEARNIIQNLLYIPLDKITPSYDAFKEEFVKLSFSKKENKNNLKSRYAINQLNLLFSGKETYEDDGSIEHIMPESLKGNVLNIGNLILFEMNLNSEADMKPYEEKLVNYYPRSNYKWIKAFTDKHKTWTLDDIEKRAETLAHMYYYKIIQNNDSDESV